MPLEDLSTGYYLNRKRIFIDTDFRESNSESIYNGTYSLGDFIEKVQSIELVGFNIPKAILPTFIEEKTHPDGTKQQGNNIVDIRLRDVPFTRELVFSVELPVGRFTTAQQLADIIPTFYEAAMDAQGDAFFNTANNVGFTAVVDQTQFAGELILVRSNQLGNNLAISMEYLFETGVNRENSAWKVLGFQEGQDTGGTNVNIGFTLNDPYPDRQTLLTPFTYVDVFVREFPELSPVARIFLTDEYDALEEDLTLKEETFTSHNKLLAPRLLSSQPLRHLDELQVNLRFQDNMRPLDEFEQGMDLIFDLIILSPEQEIPCWVNQEITCP